MFIWRYRARSRRSYIFITALAFVVKFSKDTSAMRAVKHYVVCAREGVCVDAYTGISEYVGGQAAICIIIQSFHSIDNATLCDERSL